MILGYLVVTSVLVVGLGRLGDLFGRVRMYTLGFAIYTVASLLLTIDWMHGRAGADWLIGFRLVQGVGAAFLIANSAAILTDAFPANQRGLALGLNNVVGISGQFIGLLLGGLLAPINWRLVFLVSVPFGHLRDGLVAPQAARDRRARARADRLDGERSPSRVGLVLVMIGITYGIRPLRRASDGVDEPVRARLPRPPGSSCSPSFVVVESRVRYPMFKLPLFRIRAVHLRRPVELPLRGRARRADVHADHLAAGHLAAAARLQLQPARRSAAGIYLLPLTVGFLIAGPISGILSDRYGSRAVRDGGDARLGARLPDARPAADRLLVPGVRGHAASDGALDGRVRLAEPRRRDEQPARGRPRRRRRDEPDVPELRPGALDRHLLHADDHRARRDACPPSLTAGLVAHGVPPATAAHVAHLPPVSVLFAAFLGYDPVRTLIGPHVLNHLSAANAAALEHRGFFPNLIAGPFQ